MRNLTQSSVQVRGLPLVICVKLLIQYIHSCLLVLGGAL